MMLKKAYWFVLLVLLGSCLNEPDCYQLANNEVSISFKKLYDGDADTLAILGITTGASDSTFYPFRLASGIVLPLNPFEITTDFILRTTFGDYRLILAYESDVRFVSEDCGLSTQLSNLQINLHEFDSVRLVSARQPVPTQLNTTIEALRCPRTNMMKLAFRQLRNGTEVADTVQLADVAFDYPVEYFFPARPVSSLAVPLNVAAPSTTVTLTFTDGTVRTITVAHTRTAWNEYQLCSGLTLFDDLSNMATTFSQVKVVRDSVQDPPITNFAVFK
ncbi:MAG: hypothetical protein MUE95_07595 [Cyclobacteriaceae bacterium]|nr:hypothetical protein [Cyclobacteriaceae bacterium]